MADASWLDAVVRLRAAREPAVLATVATVRGHAPCQAGAKMVVSATDTWGSIGGGNLEAVAIERARAQLSGSEAAVELMTSELSERAPSEHGAQCCGGKVTVLLEPLRTVPAVAIFGTGHVGLELARILARHDIELHLIDTRPDLLSPSRLAPLADAVATVHVHQVPVLPESAFAALPAGTHVLIMTHDHAEDAALCDAALRRDDLGSIGLIGSAGKWARFRRRLATEGGHDEATIARIRTPIGLSDIGGKEPAIIAVSVAAHLLRIFEDERHGEAAPDGGMAAFDAAPADELGARLRSCCAAEAWVSRLEEGRPYRSEAALYAASDQATFTLDGGGLEQALAGHPRIGDAPATHGGDPRSAGWSRGEQAGIAGADASLLGDLAAANAEYERRFGHVYLVCASGRGAAELLAVCRSRLEHDPGTERGVVLAELAKINQLRLAKLLEEPW